MNNGKIVGPIVETSFGDTDVYVQFGPNKGDVFQVITRDMADYKDGLFQNHPRLVNRVMECEIK